VNDRTAPRNSTGNDFSCSNNNNQRRFSYFYILAESTIQASVFTTTIESEGEMTEKHISSLILLIYNMKREYQNIFFDFTTIKNVRSQDNANEYDILYNIYQSNIQTQNNSITRYTITSKKNDIAITMSKETKSVPGSVPTESKMVDVYYSNTPSVITSGAQEEVHMFGVSHKRKLMSQDDLKYMRN